MTGSSAEHEKHIFELRHQLLRATDRAVGAEAELERCAAEAQLVRTELERSLQSARKLAGERDSLRARNRALLDSRTWRVGSLIVKPAARIARWRRR